MLFPQHRLRKGKHMAHPTNPKATATEAQSAPLLTFEDQTVRAVIKNGKRWLVASDVCRLLGLQRSRAGVSRLDEDESILAVIPTPGGPQQTLLVSESGAYHLTFVSRKPNAKRFRRWVTEEVLPRSGARVRIRLEATPRVEMGPQRSPKTSGACSCSFGTKGVISSPACLTDA